MENKTKRITQEFRLIGLNRPYSMTCITDNEVVFWPKVGITKDRFNALWDYCIGNWKDKKYAEIEHDGLREDGTPINGVVISVREI